MKISELSGKDLEHLQEWYKAKNDIVYYAEHFVQIPTPGGNEIIKLYEPQKDVLRSFVDDHYCVSLKSRQVGFSVMATIFVSYCCTFYDNVVCGVISRSADEATDFARKTLNILDNLPDWLKPEFDKRTEQTFILKNGCQCFAAGVNPANPQSVFRGKSLSVVIVDEAAFIAGISESWAGLMPAVSKAQQSAKINGSPYASLIISTPNKTSGMGKFYYDMWMQANSGDSIFKPITLAWWMIDEFKNDPDWYKTQCALLGNVEWRIDQELNCKFIQGGNSFFSAKIVKELQANEMNPISEMNIDGAILRLWEKPDVDKFYLIGIDAASAYGTDSSTVQIVDYVTCKQVGEMQFKGRVDEFCPKIEKIAQIFPNNIIIPECNSFGNQICEYLTRANNQSYNLYQSKQRPADIKNRNKIKYRYGIYTNPINRPLIIDALYAVISEDPSVVRSNRTVLELIGLTMDKNGKIAADEGEHDDLSMALAFCYYVREYDPPSGLNSVLNRKEAIEDSLEIIGWNNMDMNNGFDTTALVKNPYRNKEELEKHDINEVLNKQVQNFINQNFNQLVMNYYNQLEGNSVINVLNLVGNNSMIQ